MSALEVFSFEAQQVRMVLVEGEPWFVAADVCTVLEIGNPSQAAARLDDDEVTLISNEGRPVNVVSEPGLFSLILGSRKPQARAFKRWITHEVLPSINRTGAYVVPETREQRLAAAVLDANTVIQEAHATIAQLTPRAEAWDELASAEGDYSVGDAAKMLVRAGISTGPQRLFDFLATARWTFRGADKRPRAYADIVSRGYLAERPMSHPHPTTGVNVVDPPQIRVTVAGLKKLHERMARQNLQGALSS